ncbi:MAG: hypothetical protein WAW33_00190 [Minisyncoccia bacterium]
MKNNLVLKVVIGALIVAVAGLAVKLAMIKPTVQTNVAETTTIPPTTVTLAQTTTSTTKLSDSTCLDINKYAIPKQADTADIKIIQKALGVTPIGGNCGPKTQSALGDFINNYGYNYGNYGIGSTVCLLSQEVVIAFNEKYCGQVTNKSTWVNEIVMAEQSLRNFFDLAAAKNYTEAQKYFWTSSSNATWLRWKSTAINNGYKGLLDPDLLKYMYEVYIGTPPCQTDRCWPNTNAYNIKEITKSEQTSPNTYVFTIRLIATDGSGVLDSFGVTDVPHEPGRDYTQTKITVRKIGTQFLVTDGFFWRS